MRKIDSAPRTAKSIDFSKPEVQKDGFFQLLSALGRLSGLGKWEVPARINDDYLFWDKAKYLLPPTITSLEDKALWWQFIKSDRLASGRKLSFASISFGYCLTNFLEQQLHELTLNFGGILGATNPIPESDKQQYLIGSIMEEAIASSQIEGAITTRQQAKEMLRKNRPPRNESEQMILNTYEAVKHISEIKSEKLTPERLLELHRLITKNTLERPEEEGAFRTSDDVHIVDALDGEVVHHPPAADKLPAFIAELCRFFNDEQDPFFIHPLMKACIIHFLIGYFHPFTDGNGRTARTLFYWYLLRRGYWLTEYLSISRVIKDSRAQYYRAFQYVEVDDNDVTYFIQYQIKALRQAYNELLKYLERKQRERKEASKLQRIQGLNSRQALILQWFREDSSQMLTAKEIEIRLRVSNQTARTDLQGLVDQGFLEKISVNRKEQRYGKSENTVWKKIQS